MAGEEEGGDQVGEDELDVAGRGSVAHVPGRGQVFFRLGVVFFQELDDADVVFEGDDVGFGEGLEGWHVGSRS